MKRRQFLTGLFGAAVVSALPNLPALESAPLIYTLEEWQEAIRKIWLAQWTDLIMYGTCAIRQIDDFPFIESIPFSELVLPTTIGGLLDGNTI